MLFYLGEFFIFNVCCNLCTNLSSCSAKYFLSKGLKYEASTKVIFDCLDEGIDDVSRLLISSSLILFNELSRESENLEIVPVLKATVWLNLGVGVVLAVRIGVIGPKVLFNFKNFPGVLGRSRPSNLEPRWLILEGFRAPR